MYHIFLQMFFIGGFLGALIEIIFCKLVGGVWMSRSSVVWGQFSIVWGLAIAIVTVLLYRYRNKSDGFLFCAGTLLGGAYEYICSLFTELVFGKVFWDYSHMPFNLGGRINLLYCFFWGIAAVIWFKLVFPQLEKLIHRIPKKLNKIITWILVAFMSLNICVSFLALVRLSQREQAIQPANAIECWIDDHYNDAKMHKIYPNITDAK